MSPRRRLVVVGNGMSGARLVEEIVARGAAQFEIVVFGEESHGNYNRILLSGVLAGDHDPRDIFLNPTSWYHAHGVTLHTGARVDAIDVHAQCVRTSEGLVERYDDLVLATGSSALIPRIHGVVDADGQLTPGMFVFRTLDDCRGILAHAATCRRVAVIGGGLLGLEAAKGLLARGLDVHVIHLAPLLMDAQLDADASAVLRRQLERMGLHVRVGTATTAVLGDGRVRGLVFNDGSLLECDMVVMAAGVRPNVSLAERAGLAVERGIVVGDDLACRNVPHVFAIGECAQHRGQVYGLVAPAWEQAQVLADRLTGARPQALYQGTRIATKLKVAGIDLAVMGMKDATQDDDEVVRYGEPSRGIYKKLIVRGDRLVGAIVMGDGAIVPPLMHAFAAATHLGDQRAEWLFPITVTAGPRLDAAAIPDAARICDCNAVTKAEIVEAVLRGAMTVSAVSEQTRACTGCGSCRPEVERIVQLAREALSAPQVLTRAAAADDEVSPPLGVETRRGPHTEPCHSEA